MQDNPTFESSTYIYSADVIASDKMSSQFRCKMLDCNQNVSVNDGDK